MKTGDQVRFLSERGGGRVAGFQGNNIVLVEDDDGFQIPMPINEVIVVADDNYDSRPPAAKAVARPAAAEQPDEPRPTLRPKPQERRGGDALSVYMAYVPVDIRAVTTTRFETYIVNDSNYFISYTYLTAEGAAWHLRSSGELEPNTKLFIEEFGRDELGTMERLCVQLVAYKRDKPFLLRLPVSTQLRLDSVKFYKLHTFTDNLFFEQPAMMLTIVENDRVARAVTIDVEQIKRSMTEHSAADDTPSSIVTSGHRPHHASSPRKTNDPIVVDLHAEALLDSTVGLTPADILNYQMDTFRRTMDQYSKKGGTRIVFIHGKGQGVLRHAIIHELTYHYKSCSHQDASFREYGYGATQVTMR